MRKIGFKIFAIIVSIIILSGCSSQPRNEYFIASDGTDSNSGAKSSPFATLDKALTVIHERRGSGDSSYIQVRIEGGTYSISNTLKISENLSNISICSEDNGEVVFSGGISIPKELIKVKSDDNIQVKQYTVNLNEAGVSNYGKIREVGFARPLGVTWGEIFVNGKPMHLSRWPDKGMIPMGKVLETGSIPRLDDFSHKGGVIKYDSARIDNWANEKDVWMSGYFKWAYADDMVKIASINTNTKTITTASPTFYGFGYDKPWNKWYGVNILAELDDPGEYYIDREKGILHFISDEKELQSLNFSVLEKPFIILQDVKNVTVQGIVFEYSRGLGIAMDNTQNVTIERCAFRNLGSIGITVGKGIEPFAEHRHEATGIPRSGIVGSLQQHLYANTTFNREGGKNNVITGCRFYNLGAGGISLGGGDRLTLVAGNNLIENCVFHDLNRIDKSYQPAVHITGVGNKIRHCEIFNIPNMAIYMHGNNHLIEYNHLHDVVLEADDAGAIYYGRDPSERGTVIRYNYFENIPIGWWLTTAIYADDGSCGLTITGNVFYDAGKINFNLGGGSDHTVTNNIIIHGKIGIKVDNRLQNWLKPLLDKGGLFEKRLKAVDYQNPPYSTHYPELVSYFDNPALPKRNFVENNIFVEVEQPISGKIEWLDYKNINWETNKEPGFADWKNRDFSLNPNSIVFQKLPAFKNIPFHKIGLYDSRLNKKTVN